LWEQRCGERGYQWKRLLAVDECGHHQSEHTPTCFLRMADLLECAPDAYLHPEFVFVRGRAVSALRRWANNDPQHEDAIGAYGMAIFFGPIGRGMIASAIADATARPR